MGRGGPPDGWTRAVAPPRNTLDQKAAQSCKRGEGGMVSEPRPPALKQASRDGIWVGRSLTFYICPAIGRVPDDLLHPQVSTGVNRQRIVF